MNILNKETIIKFYESVFGITQANPLLKLNCYESQSSETWIYNHISQNRSFKVTQRFETNQRCNSQTYFHGQIDRIHMNNLIRNLERIQIKFDQRFIQVYQTLIFVCDFLKHYVTTQDNKLYNKQFIQLEIHYPQLSIETSTSLQQFDEAYQYSNQQLLYQTFLTKFEVHQQLKEQFALHIQIILQQGVYISQFTDDNEFPIQQINPVIKIDFTFPILTQQKDIPTQLIQNKHIDEVEQPLIQQKQNAEQSNYLTFFNQIKQQTLPCNSQNDQQLKPIREEASVLIFMQINFIIENLVEMIKQSTNWTKEEITSFCQQIQQYVDNNNNIQVPQMQKQLPPSISHLIKALPKLGMKNYLMHVNEQSNYFRTQFVSQQCIMSNQFQQNWLCIKKLEQVNFLIIILYIPNNQQRIDEYIEWVVKLQNFRSQYSANLIYQWIEQDYQDNNILNLFLQYEYHSEFTLKSFIDQQLHSKLSEKERWDITNQLIQGLKEIHSNNLYHSNIFTENIFIKDMNIKFCDFCIGVRYNFNCSQTTNNSNAQNQQQQDSNVKQKTIQEYQTEDIQQLVIIIQQLWQQYLDQTLLDEVIQLTQNLKEMEIQRKNSLQPSEEIKSTQTQIDNLMKQMKDIEQIIFKLIQKQPLNKIITEHQTKLQNFSDIAGMTEQNRENLLQLLINDNYTTQLQSSFFGGKKKTKSSNTSCVQIFKQQCLLQNISKHYIHALNNKNVVIQQNNDITPTKQTEQQDKQAKKYNRQTNGVLHSQQQAVVEYKTEEKQQFNLSQVLQTKYQKLQQHMIIKQKIISNSQIDEMNQQFVEEFDDLILYHKYLSQQFHFIQKLKIGKQQIMHIEQTNDIIDYKQQHFHQFKNLIQHRILIGQKNQLKLNIQNFQLLYYLQQQYTQCIYTQYLSKTSLFLHQDYNYTDEKILVISICGQGMEQQQIIFLLIQQVLKELEISNQQIQLKYNKNRKLFPENLQPYLLKSVLNHELIFEYYFELVYDNNITLKCGICQQQKYFQLEYVTIPIFKYLVYNNKLILKDFIK